MYQGPVSDIEGGRGGGKGGGEGNLLHGEKAGGERLKVSDVDL